MHMVEMNSNSSKTDTLTPADEAQLPAALWFFAEHHRKVPLSEADRRYLHLAIEQIKRPETGPERRRA